MSTKEQLRVFVAWTALTGVGLALCLRLQFIPPNSFIMMDNDRLVPVIVLMALPVLQWAVVLRRYVPNGGWWTYVTGLGYLFTLLLLGGVSLLHLTSTADSILRLSTLGFSVGFIQWYMVLRKKFRGAGWWVPANMLAYGLGVGILQKLYELSYPSCDVLGCHENPSLYFLGMALTGIVIGVITGLTITWLMGRPIIKQRRARLPELAGNVVSL